jgi:hypothetical protein
METKGAGEHRGVKRKGALTWTEMRMGSRKEEVRMW